MLQPPFINPKNSEKEKTDLLKIKGNIQRFKYLSEELIFGYVGLDALMGLIPVIGGVYTLSGGLWLYSQAKKLQLSKRINNKILRWVLIDTIIGTVPGIGDLADVFIRSHSWAVNELEKEIDKRLHELDTK